MQNLKIGFIGYGRHAKTNLYPSLKLLGINLQAIATTSKESSQLGKVEQNSKNAYSDHLEMFKNESLDCVFISAKPHEQYQLVIDALNHNLHVFVEKPPGMTLTKAKEIQKLSKEKGKFVQVAYMKRYSPMVKQLHKIINKNNFGDIVSISGMFGSRNFVTNGKDYLFFAAIHYVNALIGIMGEFESVTGFERVVGDSISQVLSIQSKSGITASIGFFGTPSWTKFNEEMYITGTNGYAHMITDRKLSYHINPKPSDNPRWQIMDEVDTNFNSVATTGSGGNQPLYQRGFVGEIESFLNCVVNNDKPLTDATDNLLTMKACEMIIEAVK